MTTQDHREDFTQNNEYAQNDTVGEHRDEMPLDAVPTPQQPYDTAPESQPAYQGDPAHQSEPAYQSEPGYRGEPAAEPAYESGSNLSYEAAPAADAAYQAPAAEQSYDSAPIGETQPSSLETPPAAQTSASASPQHADTAAGTNGDSLFTSEDSSRFRSRWDQVQAAFVDDPRDCVQNADGLVSEVVDELTSGFAEARSRLEAQWGRGEEASTEELRLTLKRYREFFDRLLAV